MTGKSFRRPSVKPPSDLEVSLPEGFESEEPDGAAEGDGSQQVTESGHDTLTSTASEEVPQKKKRPQQVKRTEMSDIASKLASNIGHLDASSSDGPSDGSQGISDDDLDFSIDALAADRNVHPINDRKATGTYVSRAILYALEATARGTGRSKTDIVNDALLKHLPRSMIVKFFNKEADRTGYTGARDWLL
jgi:hypothetical protein